MPDPSIFTTVINSYLPEPHASLLNGILFGVNLKTTSGFYDQLKAVGLLHIVVLSGMNITLLAALIGEATLWLGRKLSVIFTAVSIIGFVIFVGPQAPIVRAAIMGILTLVAIVYGKKSIALYSLFISLLVIAIVWPDWLSTISLQLSVGATLGILLFSGTIPNQRGTLLQELKTEFRSSLRTTLAAQVFTAPLIFIYFREVSLIAPISNVLVSWLIGPLMVLGFAGAILGKISFILGLIPAYLAYGLLAYMVWVIQFLSAIPFTFLKL